MEKNSFVMYIDYIDSFDEFSDEEAGRLIKAILHYQKDGSEPKRGDVITPTFRIMQRQMERDQEKWAETCRKRAEAGRKGALARVRAEQRLAEGSNAGVDKQALANAAFAYDCQANQAEYEYEYENEYENENEYEGEDVNDGFLPTSSALCYVTRATRPRESEKNDIPVENLPVEDGGKHPSVPLENADPAPLPSDPQLADFVRNLAEKRKNAREWEQIEKDRSACSTADRPVENIVEKVVDNSG